MSRRTRLVAFALCAGALVASAAALIALGPSETPADPAEGTSASPGRPEFAELEERAEARQERLEPQIEREGVAEHEKEPPEPPVYDFTQRAAEPVARRFFSAYSLYEIGQLGPEVRGDLSATTDPDFSEELLEAPPRVPGGASRPERAELGRLQLVPLGQEVGSAKLTSIELVGYVGRAGESSELLALQMDLVEGGRWVVTGFGR